MAKRSKKSKKTRRPTPTRKPTRTKSTFTSNIWPVLLVIAVVVIALVIGLRGVF